MFNYVPHRDVKVDVKKRFTLELEDVHGRKA